MRIICISDTHGLHERITKLPVGDMIIHAGDISNMGKEREIKNFLTWFSSINYKYKIFIAGNHDFLFEENEDKIKELLINYPDIIYLNDSGITIEDINIWGSPVTPTFYDWAFNRDENEIKKHWNLIPEDTNILITHGPAYGKLDLTSSNHRAGCPSLLEKIELIKPKYHIFGHIHEGYDSSFVNNTHFINASICNLGYQPINYPIVIYYE